MGERRKKVSDMYLFLNNGSPGRLHDARFAHMGARCSCSRSFVTVTEVVVTPVPDARRLLTDDRNPRTGRASSNTQATSRKAAIVDLALRPEHACGWAKHQPYHDGDLRAAVGHHTVLVLVSPMTLRLATAVFGTASMCSPLSPGPADWAAISPIICLASTALALPP
ncbi:hypothetical protein BJV78DRAFT_416235 [Lactifluus subvellereus]|nr:hypothetical protein BJV78DRAFT_416235 [Lactifluus subvellereus]